MSGGAQSEEETRSFIAKPLEVIVALRSCARSLRCSLLGLQCVIRFLGSRMVLGSTSGVGGKNKNLVAGSNLGGRIPDEFQPVDVAGAAANQVVLFRTDNPAD